MGRAQGYVGTRAPGAAVVARRERPPEGDRCASPGCTEEPWPGGLFCHAHQAILDRVRAELEADERSSGLRRSPGRRPIVDRT